VRGGCYVKMGHHEKKKIYANSIYYYNNLWTHEYDIIYKVTETVATVVMCLYWSYRTHCILLYNVLYVRITIIMHSIVFKTWFSHFTRSVYPETSVVVLSENTNIYIIISIYDTLRISDVCRFSVGTSCRGALIHFVLSEHSAAMVCLFIICVRVYK